MKNDNVYIRTLDGIYEVPKTEDCNEYIPHYGFIIKYSDYIDDLFNRVICIKPRGNGRQYKIYTMHQYKKLSIKTILKELSEGVVYYGAAWTETGLKYVAQFNTKGTWAII